MTDETRATIARGWAQSGLSQDEYAARFGVAGRTMRLWLARYAFRQPPLVKARAVVADAMERLRDLLVVVDAELGCSEPTVTAHQGRQACRVAGARRHVPAERSSAQGLTHAGRSGGAACDVGAEADATRHADLETIVAGVQVDLAKYETTAMTSARCEAASAAMATEGDLQVVERQGERHAGSARLVAMATVAPVSHEAEPFASAPKVVDADGPEDVHRLDAVRGVAHSDAAALRVADGAGPAAAPCRPAGRSPTEQQDQGAQERNDRPGVLDLEALRKRAAQVRAARAATGAPRRSPFDWDAE